MAVQFILTEYVNQILANAVYDKLEDSTFAGRIPLCKGVVAFGTTLRECEDELRSTLEDWILVGLEPGHPLPVDGIQPPQRNPASTRKTEKRGDGIHENTTENIPIIHLFSSSDDQLLSVAESAGKNDN